MTTVSVLVPFRPGDPWRDDAWRWVSNRYAWAHPDWEVVVGESPAGPFNRSAAILDAASKSSGDVLVVADADCWCEELELAVASCEAWSIPHLMLHRLSQESTRAVLDGADWRGLPLSTDHRQDSRPYRGHEAATMLVLTRPVLSQAPPDPRFVGWGQEDDAWATALRCLIGPPARGDADLVHLWHPPQERKSRVVGNAASVALLRRYRIAARSEDAMTAVVQQGRDHWHALKERT